MAHRRETLNCILQWLVILTLVGGALAACKPKPTATPTPTLVPSATPQPTLTPSPQGTVPSTSTVTPLPSPTATPQPPGSPANPIILGLVTVADKPEIATEGEALAKRLAEVSGYSVQSKVLASYTDLLAGLEKASVHVAFLPPFSYLYAHEKKWAEPGIDPKKHSLGSAGGQQQPGRCDSGDQEPA